MPLGGSHFTIRKATRSPTAPGLTPPAGGHTLDYERGLRRLSKVSTFDGKLVHFVTVKAPEPKLGALNSR
jgi:hypothetical protein